MKPMLAVVSVIILAGCATSRTLTFIDSTTRKPVAGLVVVELALKRPYFIVSTMEVKHSWTTDENGQVTVHTSNPVQPQLYGGYTLDLSALDPQEDVIPVMRIEKDKAGQPDGPLRNPREARFPERSIRGR